MPDQVPHEVKIERMERLVELTQRIARERNEARVGRVEQVLVEGPSRTDPTRAARPHAPQHDRQLHGRRRRRASSSTSGSSRRPRRRCVDGQRTGRSLSLHTCPSHPSAGLSGDARPDHRLVRARSAPTSALRLLRDGHEVFGVDKRQNPWTDAFDTLLQDLAGHYPAFYGRHRRRRVSATSTSSSTSPRTRRCTSSSREPHRALENAIMTFNVLEYCRGARAAARLLVDARGLRRRAPLRGVRRGGRRLRLHGEPVLGARRSRARRSSTRMRAATASATSSSASRTSTAATTTTCSGWSACCRSSSHQLGARRADHGLRRRRQGARLHLHRRLRRRHRARHRRARRAAASRTRRSTSPTGRATRSCARPS